MRSLLPLLLLVPLPLAGQGTARLEASQPSIRPGQTLLLRWSAPGVGVVRLEPGDIQLGEAGQLTLRPGATTTYVLRRADDGRELARTAVKVDPGLPLGEPARVCSFDASSAKVLPGDPVVLSWECTGAAKVRLEPGGLELDGRSFVVVTPQENTRYTLMVTNEAGGQTRSLDVTVLPTPRDQSPARICSFTASRLEVQPGQPVDLAWECQGEAKVRLEPGGLELTGREKVTVVPDRTTVYTLSVSNLAGGLSRSLEIRVLPAAETPPDPLTALREGNLEACLRVGAARAANPAKPWTLRMLVAVTDAGLPRLAAQAGRKADRIAILPWSRKDGLRAWQACWGWYASREEALRAWEKAPEGLRRLYKPVVQRAAVAG
ncbi:MAG TPA: hypothetical protein VJ570_04895 [Holophagaceae bacterium]|nr:hypothetical protein [Holophagaceae bacterium]